MLRYDVKLEKEKENSSSCKSKVNNKYILFIYLLLKYICI